MGGRLPGSWCGGQGKRVEVKSGLTEQHCTVPASNGCRSLGGQEDRSHVKGWLGRWQPLTRCERGIEEKLRPEI